MELNYGALKDRQRELRQAMPAETNLRVHRGLSWLKVAEASDDLDTKFIYLWIAFNSIYAKEVDIRGTFGEKGLFCQFLGKLIRLDADDLLYNIAWDNYSGKIRLFIDNPYVSRYFWDFHGGGLTKEQWEQKFDRSRRDAQRALVNKDATIFCTILFDRMYVLRNQLLHGGATWNSDMNRDQVRDGSRILEQFIPAMIHILLENPDEDWGNPCFPPAEI